MTFLRSLWADLIEKHLWPVALALLVALVAVPVFLGGGKEQIDATAPGATGATGGLGALAQVFSLDKPGATRLDRVGRLRDPFKQQAVPGTGTSGPAGTTATATATAPAPATATGTAGSAVREPKSKPATPGGDGKPGSGQTGGGSDGGGPGGGGDTPPTPKPDAKPSAPELSDYVTEIRFGRLGESRPRRTVARLTPLPTVERPFFVYLGVLTDRRTAVFLLSSDVKASGQAKCKPDNDICETIELRAGQTAKLAVTGDDESVTQYTLTVDEVRRRGTASRGAAPAAAATKPAAKRSSSEEDLGTARYRYDDATGLLRRVRASRSGKPGARLLGAKGASVSDLLTGRAPRRPGLPEVTCRRC